MKCDIKMMLKAGLGLTVLIVVVYVAFPAARPSIMALTPALFFWLCPLMMFFMMKVMQPSCHEEQKSTKQDGPPEPGRLS